jgi:hypothetical protein
MTLIEQPQPYPEPVKIVRKYAFTGSEGYVTLSIFLPQGLDLPTRLENKNRVSPDLFPAMEANARLSGYPAVAFVTGNDLSCLRAVVTIFTASGTQSTIAAWHYRSTGTF